MATEAGEKQEDLLAPLRKKQFQEPIEEMCNLLSQSNRAFLFGAGCSKCAGLPLMTELTEQVITKLPQPSNAYNILQNLKLNFKGSAESTIEDYMSELVDLISICERRYFRNAEDTNITINKHAYTRDDLIDTLSVIKRAIVECVDREDIKIHNHRQFIRSIHGSLLTGKSERKNPVDYFILNYDTLLEDALSLEKIPLADGFNGGPTGWWDARAYRDSAAEARIFKIHGSIDWCLLDDDTLPRRVRPHLKIDGQQDSILIWPASTKYQDIHRDPYSQIINQMRQTLRPQTGQESVLTIFGYAFKDSHINAELNMALHESEKRLTLIIFSSEDKPSGQIKEWIEDNTICEQVRVYANRGFYHAKDRRETKEEIPWWKFEIITRLIGGER